MKSFKTLVIGILYFLAGFPLFAHSATLSGTGYIDTGFGIYTIDNVFFSAATTGTVDFSVYYIGVSSDPLDT